MAALLTNIRGPQGPPGADGTNGTNGVDGTVDFSSAAFIEAVQDRLGLDLVAGSGLTLSYDDAGTGRVTITATGGGGGGTTDPEIVRDVIGTALIAGAGIQVTVNDAGDSITIASVPGTLGELQNVSNATPGEGTALLWNIATSQWEPGEIPSGNDASALTVGQLGLERLPPGGMFTIDYNKAIYGPAGAWPTARPTARTDLVGVWTGPTDPGTIAIAGDQILLEG